MRSLEAVDWRLARNLALKTAVGEWGMWAALTLQGARNLVHGLAAYLILVAWCVGSGDIVSPRRWAYYRGHPHH